MHAASRVQAEDARFSEGSDCLKSDQVEISAGEVIQAEQYHRVRPAAVARNRADRAAQGAIRKGSFPRAAMTSIGRQAQKNCLFAALRK